MWEFILFCIFLLGLSIGSFINVVIYRLHTGENMVRERSHCPHCNHVLGVKDLIPVVSFVLQKAKCRYCSGSISWQYPLVEMLTGLLFVLFAIRVLPRDLELLTGVDVGQLVFYFLMTSVLIIIFMYDLKHYLILNAVTYPAIVAAFAFDVFLFHVPVRNLALGLLLGAGFFFLIVVLSRERWMGWGDVKLGVLLGLVTPWPSTLTMFVLSYMLGAVVALFVVLTRRKGTKDVLPFGTFLAASAIIVMLLEAYGIDLAYKYLDAFVL